MRSVDCLTWKNRAERKLGSAVGLCVIAAWGDVARGELGEVMSGLWRGAGKRTASQGDGMTHQLITAFD